MGIALGIDTGGTYTDAVLVDSSSGSVLSTAKSLTTKQDLAVGIKKAIMAVVKEAHNPPAPEDIGLVTLSTTLATNAIAEGHGARVCLLLVGYDPELIRQYNFRHALGTEDVVYIKGGHDINGNEIAELDEAALKKVILEKQKSVGAFAVSGYFGAYNPTHELRVRRLIQDLTGHAATCGHELSNRLDSIKRATTVALNARLIPLIRDFITKVRLSLEELCIDAPLMVVKGDGSLVQAEWAMQRPIETVLSGPAASALGACKLAGKQEGWVIDMGGTTTDIIALSAGSPKLNPKGASISGWRTMVEAVDAHTVGLGGDSLVYGNRAGELSIGPQRVIPLCKLADDFPQVLSKLKYFVDRRFKEGSDQFLIRGQEPLHQVSAKEQVVLKRLKQGVQSLAELSREEFRRDPWISRRVESLEKKGLLYRAGFTPTDALHVLGRFQRWNKAASQLGAQMLARFFDTSTIEFCELTIEGVTKLLGRTLIHKVLIDESISLDWEKEPSAEFLIEKALGGRETKSLKCEISLFPAVISLGAPVEAYMPRIAKLLHTRLIIPPHAEVAGAVGAVSGGVLQHRRIYIRPMDAGGTFRIHLPQGPKDIFGLEQAVAYAQDHMYPQVEAMGYQAGAQQVETRMERVDKKVKVPGVKELYLGTDLLFSAYGRPGLDPKK